MPRLSTTRTYVPGPGQDAGRHEYDVAELRAFFAGADDLEDDGLLRGVSPKDGDVIRPLPLRPHSPALAYVHVPRRGFSLAWYRTAEDGTALPARYSVGRRALMEAFQQMPDGTDVPLGTCVPGPVAYRVLEDFAADPGRPSGAVEWIDADQLDWPDGED